MIKVKKDQFDNNPINKGDIINTIESADEKKWKKGENEKWYQIDETEPILKKWNKVK
jgi:hypothetical protein